MVSLMLHTLKHCLLTLQNNQILIYSNRLNQRSRGFHPCFYCRFFFLYIISITQRAILRFVIVELSEDRPNDIIYSKLLILYTETF